MQKSRIASIETFRVIAIFAVICIHATPFMKMEGYEFLGCLVKNLARFAVPFFLITSGYFFFAAGLTWLLRRFRPTRFLAT